MSPIKKVILFLLIIIFTLSFLGKLFSFYYTVSSVNNILTPIFGEHSYVYFLSIVLTVLVVLIEFIVVLLFLLRKYINQALILSFLLTLSFLFFNILHIIFSYSNQQCGCFGEIVNSSPRETIILDVFMLLLIIILAKFNRENSNEL